MPDRTDDLLPLLASRHIPHLDLGPEAQIPAYDGLSLLNLPASLCRWLGAEPLQHPPLALPELEALAAGARQVIVVLLDAVAHARLQRWAADLPALQTWIEDGLLVPLTSVVPSTTTTALTTLWTGFSPAEHAQAGYELLLKEYGVVANMLNHSPAALDREPGLLARAGLDPLRMLPVPTLGPRLRRSGVEAHAFLPHPIRASGLSRMHLDEVSVHGFATPADLWIGVRRLAERTGTERRLIWCYYGEVDSLSHRYGPDSEAAQAEFRSFVEGLCGLPARLPAGARRTTLLLLVSDHGQVATPLDTGLELAGHPDLLRRLHLLPTGENRLAYLYLRPGEQEAVREHFEKAWPGGFRLLDSARALQAGLFGPGVPAAATAERVGDLIALAQGVNYLWWNSKPNVLIGRHGGLSAEEMIVPLLALRPG